MDIMDIYDEGCNQITGSMTPILEYSGNSWNSICMRIGTWNSSGLLCSDLGQYKEKMLYFRSLLIKLDVLCLQETHDDGNEVQFVDHLHLIGREFYVRRSFIDAATGGLAIFLKKTFCDLFSSIRQTDIIPGRIFAVELTKDGRTSIIVNIHIHCNPICQPGKIRMLRKLKEYIGRHMECFIYIVGDFNFVGDAWDRIDLQTGLDCGKSCPVNQFWDDNFAFFTELYQPDFTRFPSNEHGRVVGTASRLDRIFFKVPLEAYALLEILVATVGFKPKHGISDHLPVCAQVSMKGKNKGNFNIPQFIFKNEDYNIILEKKCKEHIFPDCCWAKIRDCKILMKQAYFDFRQLNSNRGAKLACEKVYWAISALRANHTNNQLEFNKAISAAPILVGHLCSDSLPTIPTLPCSVERVNGIRAILSDSLRSTHAEDQKELNELRDTPGYHNEKRKESLLQKLMVHNPKRRRLGIAAVKDTEGNIIYGKDDSQRFLGKFWGNKFEEKPIDEFKAGIFVKKFSKMFPDTCWVMSWLCFLSMMTGLSKSSPGPDGIAYGGWQCNCFTQVSIYLGYMCWIHTGYLPAFFNVSFIWLLPKTSPTDGCFAPGDTRPLTGSNCDVKIFAMMLADSINSVIDKWAFRVQRGFIRGRCMLQNVIDVETKSLIFARNKGNSSALLFFDFAAAFPSIARAFIWIALIAIGFPRNVVAGIRALYKNNLHFVRTSSGLKFVFVAESGVMQGSPLSSLIFVLVTDCINRYLASLVGINDLLLAYADDLALIIEHFFDLGVTLAGAFDFISSICALRLNANKCVCIPLCNKDRWHF